MEPPRQGGPANFEIRQTGWLPVTQLQNDTINFAHIALMTIHQLLSHIEREDRQ